MYQQLEWPPVMSLWAGVHQKTITEGHNQKDTPESHFQPEGHNRMSLPPFHRYPFSQRPPPFTKTPFHRYRFHRDPLNRDPFPGGTVTPRRNMGPGSQTRHHTEIPMSRMTETFLNSFPCLNICPRFIRFTFSLR